MSDADRIVTERAERQHGVVTSAELAAAGVVRRAVTRRVAQGRLRRLHRGVFLVGPLSGPLTREMAALLAVGHDATISHRSAAALWEILPPTDDPVDVTVTRGHPRHRAGIRVHRTGSLQHSLRAGVRVTTPMRTLLDLAGTAGARELERAVEEAQVRRLVTREQLKRLRGIDFVWPNERLIVEVDGFAFHSTRAAFERDRARDRALLAAGYVVLRVTWRQLVHEPEVVVAELAAALVRQRAFVP